MGEPGPAPFRHFEDFWPFYVSRHLWRVGAARLPQPAPAGTAAAQPVS